MIRAASQAGLHSVSSALAAQAAQIQAGELQSSDLNGSRATASTTSQRHTSSSPFRPQTSPKQNGASPIEQGRRPSTSSEYSAAMKAHLTSALRGAEQLSLAASASSSSSSSLVGASSSGSISSSMAVQTQMAEIATRTAAEEAERQLRIQALLRISRNEAAGQGADETTTSASSSDPSAGPSRLEAVGLGHIVLPSHGLEQSWGRASSRGVEDSADAKQQLAASKAASRAPARYYDASDAMAGVPSLPCE